MKESNPFQFSTLLERGVEWCDSFIPLGLRLDAETLRRSRLQIRFGWMGAMFGLVYALFYLSIAHWWGAAIIVLCSICFALIPGILKATVNLSMTGQIFAFILFCGFTGLCSVEGGLYGHAIAWLASIPLCVLLLMELKRALIWAGICFLAATVFGILEVCGVHVIRTYDPKWESLISISGYGGLVCFMTLLGVIFERTRSRSFDQMKQALEQLSSANLRLVRLHHEKDEFLNIAAHDLKNPLCGINGYAELLGYYKEPSPAKIAETSSVIQKQCKRMLEIISNLLDVQRIEEGSIQMQIVSCPVELTLKKMIGIYQLRAEAKNIRLEFRGASIKTCALADESAMEQILDNLISNAIKYSPQGTTVYCEFTVKKMDVEISIGDEGPGLSEVDQANLFKKFSKLTPRPTGGESSNGLGLWIVHRMAQSMHGEVTCRSVLGQGTTFTLTLPLEREETPLVDRPISHLPASGMQGFQVA